MIACGALAGPVREIAARRGWPVELHCLPALLHNRPARIAPAVERLATALLGTRPAGWRSAYADCGSYGALDGLCERLGLAPAARAALLRRAGRARPGGRCSCAPSPAPTCSPTSWSAASAGSVLAELGLDRHPELWPDYFGHYRRVVWLAQDRDAELDARPRRRAASFGLPLTVIDTGTGRPGARTDRSWPS